MTVDEFLKDIQDSEFTSDEFRKHLMDLVSSNRIYAADKILYQYQTWLSSFKAKREKRLADEFSETISDIDAYAWAIRKGLAKIQYNENRKKKNKAKRFHKQQSNA